MSDEKEEKVDEKAALAAVQAKKEEVAGLISRFVPLPTVRPAAVGPSVHAVG